MSTEVIFPLEGKRAWVAGHNGTVGSALVRRPARESCEILTAHCKTISRVIPALIRKAHEAKLAGQEEIVICGTGQPRREFLHVDDGADACVHLLKVYFSDGRHQCRAR